ncbi:MAG: sugar-binding transcriptional regulator [Clostridium sp.]|nr:sugar-binding transcriptional regulator [Clostridium sp.]
MDDFLKLQEVIVPEADILINRRYNILKEVLLNEPIGRRSISGRLELGERTVRRDLDFFKSIGLVDINPNGVYIKLPGIKTLNALRDHAYPFKGFYDKKKYLTDKTKYQEIIIVPGDIDRDPSLKKDLGLETAIYFMSNLEKNDIIAMTGGTTIKELVDYIPNIEYKDLMIVPARGSLSKNIEIQSNSLVANLSKKLNAQYKLLNIPENLSDETLKVLLKEKEINRVIETLKKASILILGIGRADMMGRRRGLSEDEIKDMLSEGALGEAFGSYFDLEGKIIKKTNSVGIDLTDFKNIRKTIAIAGGSSKAEAILAMGPVNKHSVLITDEGAAMEMIKILKSQ